MEYNVKAIKLLCLLVTKLCSTAMHHVASSVITVKGVVFTIVENYHRSNYCNVENVKDYSNTYGCFIQLQGSI